MFGTPLKSGTGCADDGIIQAFGRSWEHRYGRNQVENGEKRAMKQKSDQFLLEPDRHQTYC
jgi:hypothetical protein